MGAIVSHNQFPSPDLAASAHPPGRVCGERDAAALRTLSPQALVRLREQLTNGIARAAKHRERARSDAEYEDADNTITDLSLRLARLAEYCRRGRVPSQQEG